VNNIWDYLRFGPIGRAFLADDRRVLLLDEIDKTDSDTQDKSPGCSRGPFLYHPGDQPQGLARLRPIIIITSTPNANFPIPSCGAVFVTISRFPPPTKWPPLFSCIFLNYTSHW